MAAASTASTDDRGPAAMTALSAPSLPEGLNVMLDDLIFGQPEPSAPAGKAAESAPFLSQPQAGVSSGEMPESAALSWPADIAHMGLDWLSPPIKTEPGASGLPDVHDHSCQNRSSDTSCFNNTSSAFENETGPLATPVRRSSRQHRPQSYSGFFDDEKEEQQGKGTRKVGRPIKYRGDPNASHLSEQERRLIKKRIANRESAQRNRLKRQDKMNCVFTQLQDSLGKQQAMQQHIADADRQYQGMYNYMQAMHCQLQSTMHANQKLEHEIAGLKGGVQGPLGSLSTVTGTSVGPEGS